MAIAAFVLVRKCVGGEEGEGVGKGGVVRDFGGFVCFYFLFVGVGGGKTWGVCRAGQGRGVERRGEGL